MNNIKIFAAGVSRRFGTSTRTNRPYDISRLMAMSKMNSSQSDSSTFQAAGFTLSELELHPNAINEFVALEGKYPLELQVTTESEIRGNNLVTVITGLAK